MIVDVKEPVITIRFIPGVDANDSIWGTSNEPTYTFNCRAVPDSETGGFKIDMIFANDEEREQYADLVRRQKNGSRYYLDIPLQHK